MARTLVGRFVEQLSIVQQVNNNDDDPLTILELVFVCEKDGKSMHIDIENYKTKDLVFNKKVSALVGKKDNRYICYEFCNIASKEFDQILREVDNALRWKYEVRDTDREKLSPEADERFMLLTTPPDKPIRLSLFIEGYKDSKNIEDDFSLDNKILLSYIEDDYRRNITDRLLLQLAIYYCNKHIEQCSLYLFYLKLITNPTHLSWLSLHKGFKEHHVLDDIQSLIYYCEHGQYERILAFNCKIANKIEQEYILEINNYLRYVE